MGKSKTIICPAILLICSFLYFDCHAAIIVPDDVPTIEALIDAHKSMKKAEDLAVVELTAISDTHIETSRLTKKYNETRTILNQRLSDVGSYVTLASSIFSIGLQLKTLIEDYKDFSETTFNNIKNQPFLLLTYTNANAAIASEIKTISLKCAQFAAFQGNILKATMDEKRQLLAFISSNIAAVQQIINRATMMCRTMLAQGLREYHVYDIINSKTNQSIMDKIIATWNKKSQEY